MGICNCKSKTNSKINEPINKNLTRDTWEIIEQDIKSGIINYSKIISEKLYNRISGRTNEIELLLNNTFLKNSGMTIKINVIEYNKIMYQSNYSWELNYKISIYDSVPLK